jgi:hypothetical protein
MNPTLKKWIKRILIGLFALIAAIIITGYVLLIANKKEIHSLITSTFTGKLSGQLVMKDFSFTAFERFPNFTIRIEDLSITDSASAARGDTLLTADEISIGIDLPRLFFGNIQFNSIRISDASFYIVKDSLGRMNTPKARKAPAASTAEGEEEPAAIPSVKKIELRNFSFHLMDSVKGKKFGLTIKEAKLTAAPGDAPMTYKMDASIHFDGLVFNPVKGGYLTDQDVELNTFIGFDPESAVLTVTHGLLELKKQYLLLNARMNFRKQTMQMRFDASSILPSVAYGALTPAIYEKLKNYELQKPVMASVQIKGFITPGSKPAVDVYFKSTDNRLNIANRSFERLKLIGWFTSHIDSTKINDDHNSKVVLPVFSASYFGLPLDATISVTDLIATNLDMKARTTYDGEKHGEITTALFRFYRGLVDIQYHFTGPLVNFVDTVNKTMLGSLSGSATFRNANFDQLASGYEFREMSGDIVFRRPDLWIDSLQMRLNGNKLSMEGTAKYFIAFLFVPEVKAYASLNLKADTIDFNSFKTPPSADAQQKTTDKKPGGGHIVDLIKWISEKVEFDVKLNADKVIIQEFSGTGVKANLIMEKDELKVKEAGMNTCGGTVQVSLDIRNLSAKQHPLTLKTSVKNVRVSDFMNSFNNFNQSTITSKNISGTVSTSVSFSAMIDKNYRIIGSSMSGDLRTRVKSGSLKDVDGLQKISKYIFKDRDFSNIEFADINNHARLQGTVLDIDTLSIFSTVITLFVSGTYDFNKTNTDLLITVPFNNLKKMEASERMGLSDSAARKGGNVTLRATYGKDGDLKMAPVVFGISKKEKEKKKEK